MYDVKIHTSLVKWNEMKWNVYSRNYVSEWCISYVVYTSRANESTHATYIVKNDGKDTQNFRNRIFCNLLSFYATFSPTCLRQSTFICFMCTSSARLCRCVTFSAKNIELPSVKVHLLISRQFLLFKAYQTGSWKCNVTPKV